MRLGSTSSTITTRNHQGKENLLLFPASEHLYQSERELRCRERLGGVLRFYHREAA